MLSPRTLEAVRTLPASAQREVREKITPRLNLTATSALMAQHLPPASEAPPAVELLASQPPAAEGEAADLLARLLAAAATPCALPVLGHDARLPSGKRGIGLPLLRAIRAFYAARGALDKQMADICKEAGFEASVCMLTVSTGLSLAESVVHAGESAGVDTSQLVGEAEAFFSYSWTGTELGDMLDAAERALVRLAADGHAASFVWVDMFCASQNLLAGKYRVATITRETDEAGYLARKEDTDQLFDGALDAISSLILYLSPLTGEWLAPDHGYLADDCGAPPQQWMRQGPAAVTRAWCLFEVRPPCR